MLPKDRLKFVQTCVTCCMLLHLCQIHTETVLSFVSRIDLFVYTVGGGLVRSWFRVDEIGVYGVNIARIKPSGHHDRLTC